VSWEPDYCSSEELLHYVRANGTDIGTEDALEIALSIAGASRAIDLYTNRQFGIDEEPTTRFYRSKLCSTNSRTVKVDDLMSLVDVLVVTNDSTESDITYTAAPVNNAAKGKPFTYLRLPGHRPTVEFEDVKVTALFGWTEVPAPVKEACLLQSSRFLARREAPFGIAGSPDQGSEMRLLARVDPDVGVSLGKYVRWWA
jgi:hypothetical protein